MRFKKLFGITLILAVVLTGCVQLPERTSREVPLEVTSYSAVQMYLALASHRAEVSDIYTDKLFDVAINETGGTFSGTFNDMVKDYLEKVHVMTQMATDRGIELTKEENEAIEEKASKYMEEYKTSGNTYDVTSKDVVRILSDLKLIENLTEQIISESNIEVSESDARVMDVIRIELDNSEDAYETLNEASTTDIDFSVLARRASSNSETEIKVKRGELGDTVEEIVFALEDGEISPVIPSEDKYYIFKCVQGYNEEATAEHKEKLVEERQSRAVAQEYEKYIYEHPYSLDIDTWNEAVKMCKENPVVPNVYGDY